MIAFSPQDGFKQENSSDSSPPCLSHSRTFHVNILLGELLFAADKPNQTGEYLPSKECGSDGPAQKDKINQPILGPFLSFT